MKASQNVFHYFVDTFAPTFLISLAKEKLLQQQAEEIEELRRKHEEAQLAVLGTSVEDIASQEDFGQDEDEAETKTGEDEMGVVEALREVRLEGLVQP